MKKLMLFIGILMIAGGISAHGYCGYRGGYCVRGPVVFGHPYIAPYVAVRPPVFYGGYGYGYRPGVCYHGGCYRGGRYR